MFVLLFGSDTALVAYRGPCRPGRAKMSESSLQQVRNHGGEGEAEVPPAPDVIRVDGRVVHLEHEPDGKLAATCCLPSSSLLAHCCFCVSPTYIRPCCFLCLVSGRSFSIPPNRQLSGALLPDVRLCVRVERQRFQVRRPGGREVSFYFAFGFIHAAIPFTKALVSGRRFSMPP